MKIACLIFAGAVLCATAPAQKKAASAKPTAPASAPAPSSAVSDTIAYPLPLEQRDKIRDLQHENDQLEIENQKMLVQLERNHARQALLVDQMTIIATQFAREKNLDLTQVELNPATVALQKKKAK